MTWTRQVFAGFETQAEQEFVLLDGSGTTAPQASATAARTGSYALRMASVGAAAFPFPAAQTRLRAAFALRHNGTSGTSNGPLLFVLRTDAGVASAYVRYRVTDAVLELVVNGVSIAEEAGSLSGFATTGQFHDIGVQANLANDSSGFVAFYVNGSKRLEYTGAITGDPCAYLQIGGTSGGSGSWATYIYVDDLYVDGSAGPESKEPPPNLRFEYLPITGAGGSAQWTPVGVATNHEAVDEAPPDGDSTYVWSETNGQRDLYAFGGYTAPAGYAIDAVIPICIARKTAAGSLMQIAPVLHDGTTPEVGTALDVPSTYGFLWDRRAERVGGGAWGDSVSAGHAVGQDAVVP